MRNIKLILQYDGTLYHGWQVQPNGITVQETIQNAIYTITREKSNVIGCGRTDSGVHADNYVCNFLSNTKIPSQKLSHAINSALPNDIVCKSAEDMPIDFHSITSATKKRYSYNIINSRTNDVFMRKYAWHIPSLLDIENMRLAAKAFLGTHDFIGFASSGFSVKTTERTIYSLDIMKTGDLITIDIIGDGFLYNMVRIIVGTLIFVGYGKINANEMPQIIASCDRARGGITAPAHGLCLKEVFYE